MPTSNLIPGNYPVVYSNGIGFYHAKYKCQAPGLVTGRSGTIGKFTLIPEGYYWPHNTTLWVTDFMGNDPLFVDYLYQTIHFENYMMGSGVPTLNRNTIHNQHVFIPSSNEQRAIATYFRHLDSLIETADKKLASLKQVKEASLQSMFPKEGQKVPEVRFKGFEGEWKELSFNNLFSLVSDYKSNIGNKTDYQEEGKYPIIDQSKEYIVGYTNEDNPIIPDNGIIVFGDHTREIKYIDFPFYTGADGTKLLHCQQSVFPLFGYYSCCSQRIPNTGYNRHYKYLKEADYIIPSLPEQRAIATYFVHLDKQIAIAQQRLDLLRRIKSACLDEMFV